MLNLRSTTNPAAVPGLFAKRPGSNERFVGNNGQFNAGSKQELINTLASVFAEAKSGKVVLASEAELSAADARRETIARLAAEYHDPKSTAYSDFAQAIAGELNEINDRESLYRRLLSRGEASQGEAARFRVRSRDLRAYVITGIGGIAPAFVKDRYVEADDFIVAVAPRVTLLDLTKGSPSLLEDVYLQGLDAHFVGTDRVFLDRLRMLSGVSNDYMAIAGGLTPAAWGQMREQIARWNLRPASAVLGTRVWNNILNNGNAWAPFWSPVDQYELMRTGTLGVIFGQTTITDGFRDENQQVMRPDELLMTASGESLGGYIDRGPITATPVDQFPDLVPARGWSIMQILAMAVTNSRAFSFGRIV